MSYALRKDGLGFRSVASLDDINVDEVYSEIQPSLVLPPPTPLEQIRAIESKPEVADAFVRATRQLLLGTWFERVKAKPAAASLTNAQIEAYCRANDPTYKTLAETEDAIKPLRGKQ